MAGIEVTDVTTSELLHHARDATDRVRRDQQVDMIGHQNIGVDVMTQQFLLRSRC